MTNIVAAWVRVCYWAVVAIREHVVADDALAGTCILVRIDEPAGLGVVVAAVQVIQRALLVESVARRPKMGTFWGSFEEVIGPDPGVESPGSERF